MAARYAGVGSSSNDSRLAFSGLCLFCWMAVWLLVSWTEVAMKRDPLYELEMCRALLDEARRQPNKNAALVRGLESDVA